MTLPEFMDALGSVNRVESELRPKSPEEVMLLMAKQVSEMYARNKALKKAAQDNVWPN